MRFILLPAGFVLLLSACTTKNISEQKSAPRIPGPADSVTRSEAIAIAQAYASTRWIAEDRHRFHGTDRDRIEVATPDAEKGGGTWKTNEINFGVPYKWGGFDTPRSFVLALGEGKYAGDISSSRKRKLLDAAVSKEAAGIDCSGLISRAWRLSRPCSTRDLPKICDELNSWDELKPGDVVNRHNGHVIMFAEWKKKGIVFYGYETGPYSGWRATEAVLRADLLKKMGYVPLRYKSITDVPKPSPRGAQSSKKKTRSPANSSRASRVSY